MEMYRSSSPIIANILYFIFEFLSISRALEKTSEAAYEHGMIIH